MKRTRRRRRRKRLLRGEKPNLEAWRPSTLGSKHYFSHFLFVGSWGDYLMSPKLSFLISKVGNTKTYLTL